MNKPGSVEAHIAAINQRRADDRAAFEQCRQQSRSDQDTFAGWDHLVDARQTPEHLFDRHVAALLDEVHALTRLGPWPHGTPEAERLGDAIDALHNLLIDPTTGGAA